LTYPSEKYEPMGRMTSHMKWKNKIHVPNHQPDIDDLPEVDRI
jgi:hypothetical protein